MSTNITIPVPAVPFAPPVYTCHRAKKPFELDGNINKPFWEDAPYTDEFLDIEGSHMPLPRFVTRAKMLWDDENLYVAAVLDGDEIWGHQTERDSVIFLDNDFEIFVDPDSDTYHYYEFEMNVLNMRRADIGIAMGGVGADAAEAASMATTCTVCAPLFM